jgi:hypothetical protein
MQDEPPNTRTTTPRWFSGGPQATKKGVSGPVFDTFSRFRAATGILLHRPEKVESRLVLEGTGKLDYDATEDKTEFIFLLLELFKSLKIHMSWNKDLQKAMSELDEDVFTIAVARMLDMEDIVPAIVPDSKTRAEKAQAISDPKVTILKMVSTLSSYVRAYMNATP